MAKASSTADQDEQNANVGADPEVSFDQTLDEILEDYASRSGEMSDLASSIGSMIQKIPRVHSVRWRVKEPSHLRTKVLRKREKSVEKYADVSVANYTKVVTDLVGVRAIHLYKEDFPEIHKWMMKTWNVIETPVAYIRSGDQDKLGNLYRDLGIDVQEHADGYRSIHYIIETQFTRNTVRCELQVRTIFEEGWSEIDHNVRYPDFSDEPIIQEFLNIFNRLSGSADEMGSFVTRLSESISRSTEERSAANFERERLSVQLKEKMSEISKIDTKNAQLQSKLDEIEKLQNSMNYLRTPRIVFEDMVSSRMESALGLDGKSKK